MIYSMTAFGRDQSEGDWGTLVWELRSVNHRYLDISMRLPEDLRGLEAEIQGPVETVAQDLVGRGLLLELGDKFLALAVRGSLPPGPTQCPGGEVKREDLCLT